MYRALLLGFIVWKLWPLLSWWESVLAQPSILLRLPGGRGGLIAGSVAALLVIMPGLRRVPFRIRPLFTTILAAGVPFLFALAVVQAAGSSPAAPQTREEVAGALAAAEWLGAPLSPTELGQDTEVILTFWASWCAPCVAELPVKAEFAARHGDAVRLVAVNVTRSERSHEAVRRFAAENHMPYPVVLDTSGVLTAMFGVRGTPTTVVIDRDGGVRDRWMGASSLGRLERAISRRS